MTAAEFNRLLEHRICKIRDTLSAKGAEYASTTERLHNFKADVGGLDTHEPPSAVLWGCLRKHLQSVYDLLVGFETTDSIPKPVLVDEKIGDSVVYLILLEALIAEHWPSPRGG